MSYMAVKRSAWISHWRSLLDIAPQRYAAANSRTIYNNLKQRRKDGTTVSGVKEYVYVASTEAITEQSSDERLNSPLMLEICALEFL